MSPEKIAAIVRNLADLIMVVRNADPADKAEVYTQLGLRLTYQPGEGTALTAV
jgi:site-specific DNA recombinase